MSLQVVCAEGGAALPFMLDGSGREHAVSEVPERISEIMAGLKDAGATTTEIGDAATVRAYRLVTAVHDAKYLDYLRYGVPREAVSAVDEAFSAPGIRQDTPVTPATWNSALRAAAASVRAAELAVRTQVTGYALVRPPGHHAGPAWHGGYCFLNNAVVAARTLREEGASRVGVLDIDYHLGNGTLACVADDPGLSFASVHSSAPHDFPFCFDPGPGLFGIPRDPDPTEYVGRLVDALGYLREADVDALVVSLGFDILAGDPHGSWSLPPETFGLIGVLLRAVHVPTVFVQEGGYGLPVLRRAAQALAQEIR